MNMRVKILKDHVVKDMFGFSKITFTKDSIINIDAEIGIYLLRNHIAKDVSRR